MGNYLLSLRVPPPTPEEDERNHPCYYDWSIPKYSPFRQPPPPSAEPKPSAGVAVSQDNIKQSGSAKGGLTTFAAANDTNIGHKTPHPAASTTKSSGTKSSSGVGKSTTVVANVSQTGAVKSLQSKSTTSGNSVAGSKSITNNLATKTNATKEQTSQKSLKGNVANGQAAKGGKAIVHVDANAKKSTTKTINGDKDGSRNAKHGTKPGAAKSSSSDKGERGKKTGSL